MILLGLGGYSTRHELETIILQDLEPKEDFRNVLKFHAYFLNDRKAYPRIVRPNDLVSNTQFVHGV